jgi:antitoxin (DNA-binding transcriptional repressor) of toxin-antitoxin stability system
MLFEVDVEDAAARWPDMMATIAAGYGVLIKRGEDIVARLAPERAFQEAAGADEDDGLTLEEREARETLDAFAAAMNDSF